MSQSWSAEGEGQVRDCPVCGVGLPLRGLAAHVASHFPETEPSERGSDDEVLLVCDTCGEEVSTSQLDSHQEAHRAESATSPGGRAMEPTVSKDVDGGNGRVAAASAPLPGHAHRSTIPYHPSSNAAPSVGDISRLLKNCFQSATSAGLHGQVLLSGHVVHYQTDSTDFGWGCGWRNVQMLVSHLITTRPEFSEALFGGCGFVPDIPTLQDWLEHAWRAGFDPEGCTQLGGRIKATKTWIGATDGATLLRFCNVRALVADFQLRGASANGATEQHICDGCNEPISGTRFNSLTTDNYDLCSMCQERPDFEGHAPFQAVQSPVNKGQRQSSDNGLGCHPSVQCDGCGILPIQGPRYKSLTIDNFDLCFTCRAGPLGNGGQFQTMQPPHPNGSTSDRVRGRGSFGGGATPQHAELLAWVWRYFNDEPLGRSSSNERDAKRQRPISGRDAFSALRPSVSGSTRTTGKPPLFFQHQGHSRTIVGVERRSTLDGAKEYNLLVLDPASSTAKTASELRKGIETKGGGSWAATLKLGLNQLTHAEYQILYVDTHSLVTSKEEYERLKTVRCSYRVTS